MKVVGSGILHNKDVSAIRRGLRIDFNSSRNIVMMRSRAGVARVVVWLDVISAAFDDFSIGFELRVSSLLIRGAGGPADVENRDDLFSLFFYL